jgi:HK97 family phage prohead protease
MERSFLQADVQSTTAGTIHGHAVVSGAWSHPLGGGPSGRRFVERIAPGAFTKSIAARGDIELHWNHNDDVLLGRRSSGTLSVWEDGKGVAFRAAVPSTSAGQDLLTLVDRGDVSGVSFGFTTGNDAWEKREGVWHRTLLEGDIFEISPVVSPAYPQTTVSRRSRVQLLSDERDAAEREEDRRRHTEHRRRRLRLLELNVRRESGK